MTTNSKGAKAKNPGRVVAKKADVPPEASIALDVPGRTIPKIGTEGGKLTLHGDAKHHADLETVLSSVSKDYVGYALLQVVNLLKGKCDEDLTMPVNAALAFIRSVDPKNELESALAAQMFATHHLSMEVMRRAGAADNLTQYEAHGNLATKLQRTFLAQLEGLGKHRRGGKQIVEHVHVAAGGQAVIAGTVNSGVANV